MTPRRTFLFENKIHHRAYNCNWFTDELGALQHHNRKLERKHKSTRLTIDLQLYKEECANYESVCMQTKRNYFTNQVMDCLNDYSMLFSIINKLLHRSTTSQLPSHDSAASLAQEFADFFDNKIVKINDQLDSMKSADTC